jgi:23S rRNA pseudouridine1911/1915/1917 synthase
MLKDDLWEYTLQAQDDGKKYQEILARKFHFSRKLLQKLKQGERAWVNGEFTYLSTRGKAGDILALQLQMEELPNIPGEHLPLDILFEDEFLLIANKPPGQVVHPTPRYPTGTLGNAVIGYWNSKDTPHPFRPVHRIDRNTSGIVVIAKNRFAHQQLAYQLEHKLIHKYYIGIVHGQVQEEQGVIDKPIGLFPGSFIQHTVSPDGLPALTRYQVLARYPQATLMKFILETGRTHQIRVHCQSIGHPLLGDDLYGGERQLIQRQALHSFLYAFNHPATGDWVAFRAPWPSDLIELISTLKAQ